MGLRKKKEKKKETKKLIEERKIKTTWYYAIKWIAVIAMIIDYLPQVIGESWNDETQLTMRIIGRIAFPLFVWELVECFHHTEHKWKHFFKIGALAAISEIPFDKALRGTWSDLAHQNVCFTLLTGWLTLICLNTDWKNLYEKAGFKKGKFFNNVFSKTTGLAFCLPLFAFAYYMKVDYTYYGVGLIILFEFARKRKHRKFWEFIIMSAYIGSRGIVMTKYYFVCYLCLILIYLAEWDKSEKQGGKIEKVLVSKPSRYISAYFYPLHLIILAIIAEVIK